jgi:hypothetical protein
VFFNLDVYKPAALSTQLILGALSPAVELTTPPSSAKVNLLKPTGYGMHQQVEHSTTVPSAHTVFMCFVLV